MLKMSSNRVIELARIVAEELGITKFNANALMKSMAGKYPVPTIICSNSYLLWVDKYYIAYSHLDEDYVHYVYIHKRHVVEEQLVENSWDSIKEQFKEAMSFINQKGNDCYIIEQFKGKFEEFLKSS